MHTTLQGGIYTLSSTYRGLSAVSIPVSRLSGCRGQAAARRGREKVRKEKRALIILMGNENKLGYSLAALYA